MNPLISIQILRAVAAWLVVFSHFMQIFPTSPLINNGWENYGWFGDFGVSIFFVTSGFIMFYSLSIRMYSAKEFFARRILRIVPAYWFFTGLMALLSLQYAQEFSYTGWNWHTLVSSLFFTLSKNPSGIGYFPLLTVGWTLSYEMFFYALLGLCILTFSKFPFWACIFTLIALPLSGNHWILGILIAPKWLYVFAYGIVLGYAYTRMQNIKPHLLYALGIFMLVLAVTLSINIHLFLNPIQVRENVMGPLFAFLLIGSALCFEPTLRNVNFKAFRFLRYLGDISYSTYLLHTLVIGVFLHYIGKLDSSLGEFSLLLIASLTIFALSHLSFQYIEIGPLQKMLKRKLIN